MMKRTDIIERSTELRQIDLAARTIAASFGDEHYGCLHVLAAMSELTGVTGDLVRAYLAERPALEAAMSYRSKATARVDRSTVRPDAELGEVLDLLERRVASQGRRIAGSADLLHVMTVVVGPHSQYLDGEEAAIRLHLARAGEGRPLALPGGKVRAAVGVIEGFIATAGLGAVILLFGAGLVLHRGALHTLAAFQHIRVQFPSLASSTAGPVRPSTVMRFRQFVWCALAPRAFLFVISSLLFAVLVVELRGIGLSPFPGVTAGTLWSAGAIDSEMGAQIVLSRHPVEVWVAIGAGFFARPASEDVERLIEWSRSRSGSRLLHAATGPVKLVNTTLAKFDRATGWLGAPAMIAAGILGVITAFAFGAVAGIALLAIPV